MMRKVYSWANGKRDVPEDSVQMVYSDAVMNLQGMFPKIDGIVIEMVLKANGNNLTETVEHLLTMCTDMEVDQPFGNGRLVIEELELPRYTSGPARDVSLPDVVNCNGVNPDDLPSYSRSPMHARYGWQPPVLGNLPESFLRVEQSGMVREMSEEENFQLLLMNVDFVSQLKKDPDFLAILEKESPMAEELPQLEDAGENRGLVEEALFKERLRGMGKMSRKKFGQLAKVFGGSGGRKKKGNKGAVDNDDALLGASDDA